MDFSKLKVEVYDFFGILVPGMVLVADVLVCALGWARSVAVVSNLRGNLVVAMVALSYVAGHLVQEAGDILVGAVTRGRYLKRARDEFWQGDEGRVVRETIKGEMGHEIGSVDVAYDYCLTRVKPLFEKREVFVATSDLARSLVFLSLTTLVAVVAAVCRGGVTKMRCGLEIAGAIVSFGVVAFVSWRRMMRFREFSDRPVFAAYLASLRARSGEGEPR